MRYEVTVSMKVEVCVVVEVCVTVGDVLLFAETADADDIPAVTV